jgi:hypothetical protein
MYVIYQDDQGYILHDTRPTAGPGHFMRVPTLADLLALAQAAQQTHVTGQTAGPPPTALLDAIAERDGYIGVTQAIQLAQEMGKPPIPPGTLKSACLRGNIPHARKRSLSGRAKTPGGGRWEFPRDEFLIWLKSWPAR